MARLSWLDLGFWGNPARAWLTAGGIAVASYLLILLLERVAARRFGRLVRRTRTDVDDFVVGMMRRTRRVLLLVPVLWLGSLALALPARLEALLRSAAILALLVQVGVWALTGIDLWVERTRRQRLEADAASATLINALGMAAKLVLWTIVVLLALDNLGVNVTALVAGLGIGGVAVALALQRVLGDLLASLSIVLDKPFVIGDTIQVGDMTGKVESIGWKTTHLRATGGEQLVFGNADLLQSRIRNFKRMAERNVTFTFVVEYGTPAATVARIPDLVREVVTAQAEVRFDRAHLKRFGETGLEFEAAYVVTTADYNVYMDRQQAIHLELLRRFAAAGIALAVPTRTVRLAGEASRNPEP